MTFVIVRFHFILFEPSEKHISIILKCFKQFLNIRFNSTRRVIIGIISDVSVFQEEKYIVYEDIK